MKGKPNRLAQDLLFAVSLGLAGLLMALVGTLTATHRESVEKTAISVLTKRPILGTYRSDSANESSSIFRLGGKGEALYASVLRINTTVGGLAAIALFHPDGALKSLTLLESSAIDAKAGLDQLSQKFAGKGADEPFSRGGLSATRTNAFSEVGPNSDAFAASLQRASDAVRNAFKERI